MKPLIEQHKTQIVCLLQLFLIGGYLYCMLRREIGMPHQQKKKS